MNKERERECKKEFWTKNNIKREVEEETTKLWDFLLKVSHYDLFYLIYIAKRNGINNTQKFVFIFYSRL